MSSRSPIPPDGRAATDPIAFTNTKNTLTCLESSNRPEQRNRHESPKPVGCCRPYWNGKCWKRCGRPKCCRECHDLWAWKHASAVRLSVVDLPPTHFMTLRPIPGMTNETFAESLRKFRKELRRPNRCPKLEYLIVTEWRNGVQHAHALLRVPETISERALHRAVRDSRRIAGLLAAIKPIRNVVGAVNYLFKHTKRPEKKAELPPSLFRGRVFTSSRNFLIKPMKRLWLEYRDLRSGSYQITEAMSVARRRQVRCNIDDPPREAMNAAH